MSNLSLAQWKSIILELDYCPGHSLGTWIGMGKKKQKGKTKVPKGNKRGIILSILLLSLIIIVVFTPCLKNGFTNWDDDILVKNNPGIKILSGGNIVKIFTSFHFAHYHPLVLLSYSLEYGLFGLNPGVYHATNVLLHIINALLVFWLFYLLSSRVSVSLVTALFFAVHPLRVESVAWIAERKDVLYALFFLGGLIAHFYYTKRNSKKYYFLCLFLFLLSLLSKAMAVSFPFVLLVIDYGAGRKITGRTLLEKAPFFALAVIFGIIAILAHYPTEELRHQKMYAFSDNVFMATYGVVFYLF